MKSQRKFKHNIVLTVVVPLLVGLLISFILGYKKSIDNEYMLNVVSVITGIWGTILGFIITAESILIGFSGSKKIEELSHTRHYKLILYTYLITCCNLLLCLCIFIPIIVSKVFNTILYQVFIVGIVVTLLDVAICIFYLWLMIMAALDKKNN